MYKYFIKRILDVIISLIGIVVLFPIFLIIFILVKMKLGTPVLFKQDRPGLNEKIFKIYKFRTMIDAKDKDGNILSDKDRLTKFGRVLRATSLDELPELINVLKGDMSLVGPRPLLVEYLSRYNEEQKHRHDVRPGITGLAQVNGRNAISWEQKFKYDLEYVKNICFILDFQILFVTFKKVFVREGINSNAVETMEEFKG